MREERLWHRCTTIFVLNSKRQFCIHKRTKTKDYCPGYWEPACGGCIDPGETDTESARRELKEEYGVTGVDVHFV